MSQKIINCKYRTQIDQMIRSGQSSRQISAWLGNRQIHISHVTIASYRNSGGHIDSPSGQEGSEPKNALELAETLLKKAAQCPDNPVKVRSYVDSATKLYSLDNKRLLSQPITDEHSELPPIEELLPKWKNTMIGMLQFYHPLYNSNDLNDRSEARRWHSKVKKLMIPILEGRLPTSEELELLNVNAQQSVNQTSADPAI
jgi:hypothetical protein